MALNFFFNGTDMQITRSTAYLDFTQDFTIFQWLRWGYGKAPDANEAVVGFRVPRSMLWGDSDYTPTYLYLGNNTVNQNDFIMQFFDGTDLFDSTPTNLVWGSWNWVGITYDASATELKFYLNDALTDTVTADLTTFAGNAPPIDFCGDDGFQNGMNGSAYERSWQRVLSLQELQVESQNERAQLRTDLLTDSPLDSINDLADRSGNGNDWTPPNPAATVPAGSGPFNAPGWALRATSAVATGTISLSITKPAGTVDGDIMVMVLAHKGAGFATMPAGWTLVEQDISGTIRGEMYWRRASGEGASYSITGLATIARGVISSYSGGIAVGDVVAASSVGTAAGGNTTGTASIAPTVPNCLLVGGFASDTSEGSFLFQNANDAGLATLVSDADLDITRLNNKASEGAVGIWIAQADAIKVVPEATLTWYATTLFGSDMAGAHVTIVAALIPAVTQFQTAGHYYLSEQFPDTRLLGPPVGSFWESELFAPAAYESDRYTYRLTTSRVDAGQQQLKLMTRNSSADANILWGRWVIGPLCAQELGGTFDVLIRCGINRNDSSSGNPIPTGVHRLYMYVTQGATLNQRAVITDFTDGTNWLGTATTQFQGYAAPQAVAATILDGDYIVCETGVKVHVPAPYPAPAIPPVQYTEARMSYGGTATATFGSDFIASVGLQDGTATSTSTLASFVTFSQELALKTPETEPATNLTYLTAAPIASLPFTTTLPSRSVPTGCRRQWFSFTATEDARVFFHGLGSTNKLEFKAYEGVPGLSQTSARVSSGTNHGITAYGYVALDVISGTTYYILVRELQNIVNAPSASGTLTISAFKKQPTTDGDVIVASGGIIARYTSGGVLADYSNDFGTNALSGVAIDYTHRPMDDLNGGTHEADRLYIALFGGSGFVEVLDLATLNLGEQEIDFISDVFDSDSKNASSLAINSDGELSVGFFGNGFTRAADSQHSYMDTIATLDSARVQVLDATHADNQAGSPFAPATVRDVALDVGGSNYIEYLPDGETLLYTSSGWYIPIGGQIVKSYNVTTGTQNANFATITADTNVNPGVKGVFPLTDGGALICNGGKVVRLNSVGAVVTTYTPVLTNQTVWLTDVETDSAGTSFWTLDGSSMALFKFDLASGTQLLAVQTDLVQATATSLVVYRTSSPSNNPTSIPIDVTRQWRLLRFDMKPRKEETA